VSVTIDRKNAGSKEINGLNQQAEHPQRPEAVPG